MICMIIFIIVIVILLVMLSRENFDMTGLVYNRPPNWFMKQDYNPSDWIVTYNPDQISKPECQDFRGDYEDLNYMSSAYRYWRF